MKAGFALLLALCFVHLEPTEETAFETFVSKVKQAVRDLKDAAKEFVEKTTEELKDLLFRRKKRSADNLSAEEFCVFLAASIPDNGVVPLVVEAAILKQAENYFGNGTPDLLAIIEACTDLLKSESTSTAS